METWTVPGSASTNSLRYHLRDEFVVENTEQTKADIVNQALFRLPATQQQGWLVAHVNNNRASRGCLRSALTSPFSKRYPS